ncbi:MAG: DNA adenine methylase [Kordiimonadaceae bacterium]|nr:DNA adenine methylase [Kordiimonadaceae bacterium]
MMKSSSVDQKVTRPALRWHGGKWKLAPWIIDQFPPHRIYTEVYGGAASVLLRKPRCYSVVYNDLDGAVVNFFQVLRNEQTANQLVELLEKTPYSRTDYFAALEPSEDSVEDARRLVVRSYMGFGSNAVNPKVVSGFRSNSNRSGSTPAHDWRNYPLALTKVIKRLRGVVIESRPALQVLKDHDAPDALHYVDPPYVHSTRCSSTTKPSKGYVHEMTDEDHRELAQVLQQLQGSVVLSGYACDLYDKELFTNWQRIERKAHADGARERVEVLWLNDAAATAQLPLLQGVS